MSDKVMKKEGVPFRYLPFEDLKDMLEEKSTPVMPPHRGETGGNEESPSDTENDTQLFIDAMDGVIPLAGEKHITTGYDRDDAKISREDNDDDVVEHLTNLVERGEGFVVEHTPEYIEGTGYSVSRELVKRLHRGEFSIQAHIDLHGLTVLEAKAVFDEFLSDSIAARKRAVLVVHGRGLSSPAEPVLKAKVVEWLKSGTWRKWVMAFSSARRCDGGAGATYVLLRRRPATKRLRKKKKT